MRNETDEVTQIVEFGLAWLGLQLVSPRSQLVVTEHEFVGTLGSDKLSDLGLQGGELS